MQEPLSPRTPRTPRTPREKIDSDDEHSEVDFSDLSQADLPLIDRALRLCRDVSFDLTRLQDLRGTSLDYADNYDAFNKNMRGLLNAVRSLRLRTTYVSAARLQLVSDVAQKLCHAASLAASEGRVLTSELISVPRERDSAMTANLVLARERLVQLRRLLLGVQAARRGEADESTLAESVFGDAQPSDSPAGAVPNAQVSSSKNATPPAPAPPVARSGVLLAAIRRGAELLDELQFPDNAPATKPGGSTRRPDFGAVARRFDREERARALMHIVALIRRYATLLRSLKFRRMLHACGTRLRLAATALRIAEERLQGNTAAPAGGAAAGQPNPTLPSPGRQIANQIQQSPELGECRAALAQLSEALVFQIRHAATKTESEQQQLALALSGNVNIWDEELEAPGRCILYERMPDGSVATDPMRRNTGSVFALRAGTLNQLVMRLTAERQHEVTFVKAVIVTLQTFTTPAAMFQKLMQRFHVPREKRSPVMTETTWHQQVVLPIRIRILNFLRLWLELRFEDFDYQLIRSLNQFLDSPGLKEHAALTRIADQLTHLVRIRIDKMSSNRLHSKEQRSGLHMPKQPEARVLMELLVNVSEDSLAKELTMRDCHFFSRLQATELLGQAWAKPKTKHRAPNVLFLAAQFNTIAAWVTTSVLAFDRARTRARVLAKFVGVCSSLLKLGNFNTLFAVLTGLQAHPVTRLKFTRREVAPNVLAELDSMYQLLLDGDGKTYRAALRNASPPKIPYLGYILTQLTFIDEGNPDFIRNLINFRKRELIYNAINEVLELRNDPYNINPDKVVRELLRELPHMEMTELRRISKELEPQNATSVQ